MRLRKRQRVMMVVIVLLLGGAATALVLTAMKDEIAFFVTPTQLAEQHPVAGKRLRMGGLVVPGSIERRDDGSVAFELTDNAHETKVVYKGILPDLFREGQGIVAQGAVGSDGVFAASEVLAKHDEKYMPKEVAEAMKSQGIWQGKAEAATQ